MAAKRRGNRHRQRTDAELYDGAIRNQAGDLLRHGPLRRVGLRVRHVDDLGLGVEPDVDVGGVDQGVSPRHRELGVDDRDDRARCIDHGLGEVGDDAQRGFAGGERSNLDQHDIQPQRLGAKEAGEGADGTGDDLRHGRHVAIGAGAVQGPQIEMRDDPGPERGRRRQAEEQGRAPELGALRKKQAGEGEGLAGPLRPADHIARAHMLGKVKVGQRQAVEHRRSTRPGSSRL